jgi:adenylate kinase
MCNLILFGPPGSGKGTQSKKLAEKCMLKHVSTGDILRNEVKTQTVLGKKAQAIMNTGELVPDELLIEILHAVIDNNKSVKGFIFDGFPRTVFQAEALDALMLEVNSGIKKVFSLEVADDEVITRLLKRAEIEGRKDDNTKTINKRLSVYKKQTSPLLNYYDKQGKLNKIEGAGNIDAIFDKICAKID